MASPVVFKWEDPNEILGPAVNGAKNILKSAKKYGLKVKRVVITSSTVAVIPASGHPDGVYDEVSTRVLRRTENPLIIVIIVDMEHY